MKQSDAILRIISPLLKHREGADLIWYPVDPVNVEELGGLLSILLNARWVSMNADDETDTLVIGDREQSILYKTEDDNKTWDYDHFEVQFYFHERSR